MDLTFEHVTKFYGPVIGVNDVSCRIGPGITCLFGANGAGKSTLMKLASGQLRPTQGSVLLGGRRAWTTAAKRELGFCPDLPRFYDDLTGREFVETMARLHGLSAREARRRCDRWLDALGMQGRAERRIGSFSHGMRQRIKLAQTLVHDPQVLVLDEPLLGIDPGGRHEISTLLVERARAGATVLVSSHLLHEVERLTNTVVMLARGRVIASGTLAEIRALLDEQPFSVEIVADRPRELAGRLIQTAEVLSVEVRETAIVVRTKHPGEFHSRVADLVLEEGFEVRRLATLDAGADAVFGYLEQATR